MREDRSVKFDKPINFSKRVLVGNWVEERSEYKKHAYQHKSVYSDDYIPKPYDIKNNNLVWNQKLKAEGHGFGPSNTSTDPCTYYNNYSTTYNLSYTYFPRWFKAPIFRNLRFRLGTYEPQEEYLRSYGSLSNYGLGDEKKNIWKCNLQDPRTNVTTSYEDSFLRPEKSDYTYFHWCRTTEKKDLPKCNVITWECEEDRCC